MQVNPNILGGGIRCPSIFFMGISGDRISTKNL